MSAFTPTGARHTPGLWKKREIGGGKYEFLSIQNGSVLRIFTIKTTEANARLIVAAPELLEALEGAEEWLSGWVSAEPYISIIRAAITKAREEQT